MKHLLTFITGVLFFGDGLAAITGEVWLCLYAGWFTFIALHFDYTNAKLKHRGTSFDWRQYWDDNGVMYGVSFLIIAPAAYTYNQVEVITPLTAFALGYFNIHAIKRILKRSKFAEGNNDNTPGA